MYGIRNATDLQMIRIKCPHGELTANQLDVVADITEQFTRTKLSHVTTRQAIQIHHVLAYGFDRAPPAGGCRFDFHRKTCGNTVRNVTATPQLRVFCPTKCST